MLEGLYSAASGMEAQQQSLDAISNDLANLDTPGYQSERVGFEDLLYSAAAPTQGSGVTVGAGAQALNLGPSQVSAGVQQTGDPLDLAINGNAYFEVKQPGGSVALTLNGQFELDAKGQLVTGSGMIVQPPITVPSGVSPSDITIAGDGTLSANGKTIGKIALVTVAAPEQLTPSGDSLLLPGTASGSPHAATGASIVQGSLNNSNVDLASEMTQMMGVENSYSMSSKAIDIQSQMLQIANQVRG
jgi:flagellar basal-body rod protein FlgG